MCRKKSYLYLERVISILAIVTLCAACKRDVPTKEWGDVNKGLRIRIAVKAVASQRHEVTLYFQNASDQPLGIFQSQFWLNTKIQCHSRETGVSAEPTAEGKGLFTMFSPGGQREKNALEPLSPGQVYESDTIELERVYQLTNGVDYQVVEIYQEGFPQFPDGWSGAVTSNIVNLRLQ